MRDRSLGKEDIIRLFHDSPNRGKVKPSLPRLHREPQIRRVRATRVDDV